MKKIVIAVATILMALAIFYSCEDENSSKGVLKLSITDSPIDMTTVSGVYLTITEIQYHKSENEWMTFEEFEGPKTFNILKLTDGNSELLGSFSLDAGHYTQLRFLLDAPEESFTNFLNPGCYIKFTDGSKEPLFVPSGSTSGWKAVGTFKVPSNGEVAITADFDARKSIIKHGAYDYYILKPTIRIIVDDQAGKITGGITNIPADVDIVIYAYEDGVYTFAEAEDPVNDTTARFPNAVTSDIADDTDSYHLAFLAPMTYDLIITTSVEGEFQEVLGIVEDVVVESKSTTNQPIDISLL